MKSTKKSLIFSALSTVLCIAMLLGTTLAWFTDSVTSGKNQIIAGNLDVELKHSNGSVTDADVKDATNLFKVDLWEPGVIAYENFTVSNVGNLALKYQLKLNTFKYNSYNGHDLTEVLKVAVVAGGFTGERAGAQALDGYTKLSEFAYNSQGWLKGGETGQPFGVVIYWEPGDNDNLYNVNNYTGTRPTSDGQPLFVEFGVDLYATQKDYEKDSFDETYDASAADFSETTVEPIIKPLIVPVDPLNMRVVREPEDGETLTLDVKNQDMTVTYTVGTKLTESTALAEDKKTADSNLGFEYKSETSGIGVTIEAGEKLANYELTLNIAQDNIILNKITKIIPAGLLDVKVYHNSTTPMTELASADATPDPEKESYFYEPSTGLLTVWVFHASELDVKYSLLNVFQRNMAISNATGVDILPNENLVEKGLISPPLTSIGLQDDEIAYFANQKGVDEFNKIAHGATFAVKEGWEDAQTAENAELLLDYCKTYTAKDKNGYLNDDEAYRYWHGDFVMKFNKPIDAFDFYGNKDNTVVLAGNYGDWGWLKIACPVALDANEEYRMLGQFTGNPGSGIETKVFINYEELCKSVQKFECGAFYLNDDYDAETDPLTVTIELRMYETLSREEALAQYGKESVNIETGKSILVDTFTYTFK